MATTFTPTSTTEISRVVGVDGNYFATYLVVGGLEASVTGVQYNELVGVSNGLPSRVKILAAKWKTTGTVPVSFATDGVPLLVVNPSASGATHVIDFLKADGTAATSEAAGSTATGFLVDVFGPQTV